jgi:hypothetical protein
LVNRAEKNQAGVYGAPGVNFLRFSPVCSKKMTFFFKTDVMIIGFA